MTINLEDYIGKTVEVELRNGKIKIGKVDRTYGVFYISGICRPSGQIVEYYNDGTNISLTKESPNDIIKIKEIKELKETPTEPETMSNVIRSKIDVFTTENERVEVTLDDDGLFLTACGKGAREDLSIGSKDLVISVACCILEYYGV
jgi:hypothetical protein